MEDNILEPLHEEANSMEGLEEEPLVENQEYLGKEREYNSDPIKVQEEFLHKLGLTPYFPEKISLQTVMENSSGKLQSLSDIPWYFLTKMLLLDYRGRDDLISEVIKMDLNTDSTVSQNDGSVDDFERLCEELTNEFSSLSCCSSVPHPLDVIITVFRCSSNFVRQILCKKMFMCKLSIPILMPPFIGKESLYLLWSLRNISIDFRETNGVLCESSVVNIPTPVVSCLRLGEISRSKSKFLNALLNCDSHHTFFHRDCKNGMNNRVLSDGLVEVAWYLPSEKSNSFCNLEKESVFFNLRGDGTLQETGRKFICQVSNVVLVMLDICALDKQNIIDNVKSIASNDVELVLLLTKQSNVKCDGKNAKILKTFLEAVKCDNFEKIPVIIFDFKANVEKNIENLKEETVAQLSECLARKTLRRNFESFESLAKSLHITVDEHTLECIQGHKKASELVHMARECGADNLKTAMLPLQGTPCQEWAQLNKEEHRREKNYGEDLSTYMNKICIEKKKQRTEQLRLMTDSHILLDKFARFLLNSESEERLYYMKWLKYFLDDQSRKTLPRLQIECTVKWNQIRLIEEGEDNKIKLLDLQRDWATLKRKLEESSFGLEHFIREIAQAYEATETSEEKGSEMHNRIVDLPRIMAELMLRGYPLELMDGDAAHVPLTWINAVLEQLRKLIGEQKIFVLSVLGIQSSGKSTMLNTMFGLQFAVSAGRCTRGVYAQLVPACKDYSGRKYDYILVVDTEGLRAADLGSEKLQHDNELATLVIGLGDVTLVNIKGESVSEIEDVLQVVIHALLKMKLVNRNMALQPSCFFIHQNVQAPDAAQQLRSSHQMLIQILDKVTTVAGKQEDAPEIKQFSQLINFDINTNIAYFSDLWRGDPPMAPVNPGYSESVSKVKQILLTDIMEQRASHLNISRFNSKLKDLWDGILDQNFVFSFKNNLEMQVYSSLAYKLSDILWSLKRAGMEWQNGKENYIVSSEKGTEELRNSLKSECYSQLAPIYSAARVKLQDIFDKHEDQSIVEQWRSSTFQKLDDSYNDIIRKITKSINLKLKTRQIQIDQRKDMTMYQGNLIKEAKRVAEKLRLRKDCQNMDAKVLEGHFDLIWEHWITKLPENIQDNMNIKERVSNVLFEQFPRDHALVLKAVEEMHQENLNSIHMNFENGLEKFVWKTNKDILKIAFSKLGETVGYVKGLLKGTDNPKITVGKLHDKLCTDIKDFVQDPKYPGFKGKSALDLIQMASDMISMMFDSGITISEIEEFSMFMSIWTCQYACYEYSRKGNMDPVVDGKYIMGKFGIHPYFEQELSRIYSHKLIPLLHEFQLKYFNRFLGEVSKYVTFEEQIGQEDYHKHTEDIVNQLYDEVEFYCKKKEIQDFREEYVEEIIKIVVEECDSNNYEIFTKKGKIKLAVRMCHFILPSFCEKHKRYIDNTDPRKVFQRDYYGTYLQMFKNVYNMIADEKTLSLILCEHLSKAIEQAVDKDMARELADDVRNNITEIRSKSSFLKAILLKLLDEDKLISFDLYLRDTNECFELWMEFFIDNYLFSKSGNSNRYSEISSRKITSLISKVCKEISGPMPNFPEETRDRETLGQWISEFQKRVKEMIPFPSHDLLNLIDGYAILNVDSFTENLKQNLQASEEKLIRIFHQHTTVHLRYAHEDSVYRIMLEECKGCTEKCPFCSAPCTMTNKEHIACGIKHMAKEHYPQACGRSRWKNNKKLIIDNCSTLVASKQSKFQSDATEGKFHLYKNYKTIYPDWNIDPDPSVEASPYWKWVLVKYGSHFAELYDGKMPDIPSEWNKITNIQARKSVE